ncbi:hypothetical protein ACNQS2_11425, partial [Corynebacterium diphtheriae]
MNGCKPSSRWEDFTQSGNEDSQSVIKRPLVVFAAPKSMTRVMNGCKPSSRWEDFTQSGNEDSQSVI